MNLKALEWKQRNQFTLQDHAYPLLGKVSEGVGKAQKNVMLLLRLPVGPVAVYSHSTITSSFMLHTSI